MYKFIDFIDHKGSQASFITFEGKTIGIIQELFTEDDYRVFTIPYHNQLTNLINPNRNVILSLEETKKRVLDIPYDDFIYKKLYQVRGTDIYGIYHYYNIDQQSGGYPYWGNATTGELIDKTKAAEIAFEFENENKNKFIFPNLIYKIEIIFKEKCFKTYINTNAEKYKNIIELGNKKC